MHFYSCTIMVFVYVLFHTELRLKLDLAVEINHDGSPEAMLRTRYCIWLARRSWLRSIQALWIRSIQALYCHPDTRPFFTDQSMMRSFLILSVAASSQVKYYSPIAKNREEQNKSQKRSIMLEKHKYRIRH